MAVVPISIEVPDENQRWVGYGNLDRVIDTLERVITRNPYIAGADTSRPQDVYVGAQIGLGLQFGTIDKRPELEEYWGRISGRDARVRAQEIDDTAAEQTS